MINPISSFLWSDAGLCIDGPSRRKTIMTCVSFLTQHVDELWVDDVRASVSGLLVLRLAGAGRTMYVPQMVGRTSSKAKPAIFTNDQKLHTIRITCTNVKKIKVQCGPVMQDSELELRGVGASDGWQASRARCTPRLLLGSSSTL